MSTLNKRGVLITVAISNGFGVTSPRTSTYTIYIPLERLPEGMLEQVGFQLYRKY